MGEFRQNLLQVQKNADNRKFKCDVALLSVFFLVMPLHAPYPRHQGWSGCSVPGARGDERMPRCLNPKMSFSNSVPPKYPFRKLELGEILKAKQLWLVLGLKLMEISSNLFSR